MLFVGCARARAVFQMRFSDLVIVVELLFFRGSGSKQLARSVSPLHVLWVKVGAEFPYRLKARSCFLIMRVRRSSGADAFIRRQPQNVKSGTRPKIYAIPGTP